MYVYLAILNEAVTLKLESIYRPADLDYMLLQELSKNSRSSLNKIAKTLGFSVIQSIDKKMILITFLSLDHFTKQKIKLNTG